MRLPVLGAFLAIIVCWLPASCVRVGDDEFGRARSAHLGSASLWPLTRSNGSFPSRVPSVSRAISGGLQDHRHSPGSSNKTVAADLHNASGSYGGLSAFNQSSVQTQAHVPQVQAHPRLLTSRALCALQIGMISTILTILYLVNWHHAGVRDQSWKVLSGSISLFLALLFLTAARSLASFLADARPLPLVFPAVEASPWGDLLHISACLLLVVTLLQILLLQLPAGGHAFQAASWFGRDVIALTFMEAFQVFSSHQPWSSSPYHTGLGLMVCLASGLVLASCCSQLRHIVEDRGCCLILRELAVSSARERCGTNRAHRLLEKQEVRLANEMQDWHDWNNRCSACLDEALAFAVGSMVSQIASYSLSGQAQTQSAVTPKSLREIGMLSGLTAGVTAVVACLCMLCGRMGNRHWRFFLKSQASCIGWCTFRVGEWLVSGYLLVGGSEAVTSRAVLAFCFGIFAVIGVLVLDILADGEAERPAPLHVFFSIVRLLLGTSWACCLTEASKDAGSLLLVSPALWQGVVCFIIAVTILPAWALHIHPKAISCMDVRRDDPRQPNRPGALTLCPDC
eukprot:TRINITY_DN26568_c0_g1_i1.p1 TRINITY_DN26568_c0_g1~~TRINITY_DN26568_c0_g1_i1.p1  ORF type:complete len:569 (-),score=60.38 TRINITY_DN26568_c0_g1_i1:82-1788(-)